MATRITMARMARIAIKPMEVERKHLNQKMEIKRAMVQEVIINQKRLCES